MRKWWAGTSSIHSMVRRGKATAPVVRAAFIDCRTQDKSSEPQQIGCVKKLIGYGRRLCGEESGEISADETFRPGVTVRYPPEQSTVRHLVSPQRLQRQAAESRCFRPCIVPSPRDCANMHVKRAGLSRSSLAVVKLAYDHSPAGPRDPPCILAAGTCRPWADDLLALTRKLCPLVKSATSTLSRVSEGTQLESCRIMLPIMTMIITNMGNGLGSMAFQFLQRHGPDRSIRLGTLCCLAKTKREKSRIAVLPGLTHPLPLAPPHQLRLGHGMIVGKGQFDKPTHPPQRTTTRGE